ncbi:Hypothetical protein SCLAV_4297 [Streptomyces clavuligerus]|uniref:Uncharacterized protein n=1 Tax=Streptomyces clavuligerus TaxID=1901 RepID=B5GL27_STRCL|nr:hypothetical protein SSCG_00051 [Streptomyces clavuligerus]EFG09371.1 Hypothetical protein SCLAV_4297 [Streptomyces clavuligerus]
MRTATSRINGKCALGAAPGEGADIRLETKGDEGIYPKNLSQPQGVPHRGST